MITKTKINPKQNNYYFKLCQVGLLIEIQNALRINNTVKLDILQRLAGISVDWVWVGACPSILSYLTRATNEFMLQKQAITNPNIDKSIINFSVSFGELKKRLRGVSNLNEWLNDLAKEKLIDIKYDEENTQDPYKIQVSLNSIWNDYLTNFQILGRDDEIYIESLGKLIAIGILTKKSLENPQSMKDGGVPSGVTATIPIIQILNKASQVGSENQVTTEFCENEFAKKKGIGRFSRIISHDNSRTDNQRIFGGSTGTMIEVKQEAINAYKLIQNRANMLDQKIQQGLEL